MIEADVWRSRLAKPLLINFLILAGFIQGEQGSINPLPVGTVLLQRNAVIQRLEDIAYYLIFALPLVRDEILQYRRIIDHGIHRVLNFHRDV